MTNDFYIENGVLVKFNASEFEGNLNDLYVPKGVTEISENAFEEIDTVETLYIPKGFEIPEGLWGISEPDSVEIKYI